MGWIAAAILFVVLIGVFLHFVKRLEATKAELAEQKVAASLSRADLEEARASARRQLREAESEAKHGAESLARALLPVDDALSNALRTDSDNVEAIRDGLALVRRQLEAALAANGAEPVEPEPGEPFDPHTCDCVAEAPGEDGGALVIEAVARRGWRLHDRLLRPAEVVATRRHPADEAEPAPTSDTEEAELAPTDTDDPIYLPAAAGDAPSADSESDDAAEEAEADAVEARDEEVSTPAEQRTS